MRLPRDLSGVQLVHALGKLGYLPTRQTGSHVRLTCQVPAQHHITVPLHSALRVGTLAAVLAAVADAHAMTRDELLQLLFIES